jgi:hypothetical protein
MHQVTKGTLGVAERYLSLPGKLAGIMMVADFCRAEPDAWRGSVWKRPRRRAYLPRRCFTVQVIQVEHVVQNDVMLLDSTMCAQLDASSLLFLKPPSLARAHTSLLARLLCSLRDHLFC